MPPQSKPSSLPEIRDYLSPDNGGSLDDLLPGALAAIRKHLRMDVAFLSQFNDGRRVFRAVDAEGPTPVVVGGSDPLEASYCQRVIDGRLPELIHNARALPEAMALPVTAALPVGAHMSVPVRLPDGSLYGTFCCFRSEADPTLNDRDLVLMRIFADWVGSSLEKQGSELRARMAAHRRVESALRGDCLTSVYQAIYKLPERTIAGFECLSRFSKEPKRSPDVWFAEATGIGLGADLEIMAIETGLRGLNRLPDPIYVSVNVSPKLLADRRLQSILSEAPAHRVVIELTEHENVSEYGGVLTALRSLRARGIRIAVDDAGAGYSSFRHILEIMPAFIKLDISLTRGIDQDPARRALTAAMVRFGEETRSVLVAEGIETQAELETLQSLGVTAGQGFLLQRPQTIDIARSLLVP